MINWNSITILCLGGAGQTGKEICRKLADLGAGKIIIHDLELARSKKAVEQIADAVDKPLHTKLVASAGNLFHPLDLGSWERIAPESAEDEIFRETTDAIHCPSELPVDSLQRLIEFTLGSFNPEVVKRSMVWNLVRAYRPQVVVDAVNTATVLGSESDLVHNGRAIASLSRRILEGLGDSDGELSTSQRLRPLVDGIDARDATGITRDLLEVWRTSFAMTAFLDTAWMIRFVQCLHDLFLGESGIAVPEFKRYVKVHTTGTGGMGFNIRFTHGDTGEPGLSTKLLGKVCAAGSLTQLLLTLSHTPGCDVRVVVPATLVGWEQAQDSVIYGQVQHWKKGSVEFQGGVLPLVDCREIVPCDGSVTLRQAMEESVSRVETTGEELRVPFLHSGENKPYAVEDITAITTLGQMGCISKEEVGRAVLECIEGDSRYDVLSAIDSAILLPTQTAAVVRDRELQFCRRQRETAEKYRLPSVSLGNLGPTTSKNLYEIEILRAAFETVERVAYQTNEIEMSLRACAYLLEDNEGALLRRQILSIGIPVFLARGPGDSGLLLGNHLRHPDPQNRESLDRTLDIEDETVLDWLRQGWIDLTPTRMAWWRRQFTKVFDSLDEGQAVSRNWFDPREPFHAGEFLGYLYSISSGQRKEYM